MERNLIMGKGCPSRPMRSWQKNTGPGDSSLIAIAVSVIKGLSSTNPTNDPTMSMARFRLSFQPRRATSRTDSSGIPLRSSTVSPPDM